MNVKDHLCSLLVFSRDAMTALKKAQTQERRRGYIWGVGFANAPYILIFPNGGCFFQWTQAMQKILESVA
jgi:hypothetical protein